LFIPAPSRREEGQGTKRKSPGFAGTFSEFYFLSRTHHSLKPRSGTKEKVVKVKRGVVDLHVFHAWCDKDKPVLFLHPNIQHNFYWFFY
jgi:hypothetical protein